MCKEARAFLDKLRHGSALEPDDERVITDLITNTKRVEAGVDLFVEGDARQSIGLIAEGWACHSKHMMDGRRQIVSLLVAGDLCQPFGSGQWDMTDSLFSLTPITIAYLSPRSLRDACKSHPRIEEALWWDLRFMRELQSELVASLGRRNALERLAYLYCELYFRLSAARLIDRPVFDVPMTQAETGDLMGLSTVHVNRSLKALRDLGLVRFRGRRLSIEKLDELIDIAGFQMENYQLKVDQLRTQWKELA